MERPEAGWYPDPEREGRVRYWDGVDWTDHVRETAPAEPTEEGLPAADPPQAGMAVAGSAASDGSADAGQAAGTNPGGRGLLAMVAVVLMLLVLGGSLFLGRLADGDEPDADAAVAEAPDDGAVDDATSPDDAGGPGDDPDDQTAPSGDGGEDPGGAGDGATSPDDDGQPQQGPEPGDRTYEAPFALSIDPDTSYVATITTSEGDIVVELDAAGAPVTTNNLVNLARDGYYDGVTFHRVIQGFVIQGGDPTGTGAGGPGYRFEDELGPAEALVEAEGGYPRGTLAMANAGPDTNGSQFFIVHGEMVELPPAYTVFGRVVDGLDVVERIAATPTDATDRPTTDVTITRIEITES